MFDVEPFAGEPIGAGVAPRSAAVEVDVSADRAPTTLAEVVKALADREVAWTYAGCADGTARVEGEEALAPGNADVTLRFHLVELRLEAEVEAPQEGDTGPVAGGPAETYLEDCPTEIADALRRAL